MKPKLPLVLFAFSLACFLGLADPLLASERKEPYRLNIVLSVARNRLLTDVFRQQVARELRDGLQAALGDLARVEVDASDKHPLVNVIRRVGLEKALDGYSDRSGVKTHFVLIDYVRGHYEIAARQYDGSLGLPGPVVRHDRTRDRALVARTAALLVDKDLGLVGTVTTEPDAAQLVKVELRGGGLGVPLERWVHKGDVFALVQPPAGPGQLVPWAYLQAVEDARDGAVSCKLFHRYKLARAAGLRCVQLGTVTAPVRLRLVQELPGGRRLPLEGFVTLQIRRHGFEGETNPLQFPADGTRDVDTSTRGEAGRFTGLAFVTVLSGDSVKARVPIALVADRLVVLPVPASSEDNALFGFRLTSLRRGVADSSQVLADLFKEINTLSAKPEQRKQAIAKVRDALARCREDHDRLSAERAEVAKEIARLPERERPSLAAIDRQLGELKASEGELQAHVARLEKIEREENDPRKRKWLEEIEQAKLQEKEGDLDKAIAIYEKVKKEGFKSEELDKYLVTLKKLWEPRSPEHREARLFIYRIWPALTTEQLKDRLKDGEFKDAHKALEECRKVNDLIGARRLLKGTQGHVQRLEKELEALKPEVNIDDQKPANVIKELVPALEKLDAATRAFLDAGAASK